LDVLEEGLFDFNLNLELVNLKNNKISFIDSNIFDNLVKLRILSLDSNVCIDMKTEIGLVDVQNVIKAVKEQCNDPSYLNLIAKFKNLETELNADNLMDKLRIFEVEIQNSKFINFFDQKIQIFKADQMKKSSPQPSDPKKYQIASKSTDNQADNKDLKKRSRSEPESHQKDKKSDTPCPSFNETLTGVKNGIKDAVMRCTGNFAGVHQKFSILNETMLDIHKAAANVKESNEDIVTRLQALEDNLDSLKTFSNERIEKIENRIDFVHADLIAATTKGINELEKKIDEKFQHFEKKIVEILKGMKFEA
jgi:hypothetical protein